MRVKNMLIYICGFTRGGCQIILDKAWKCFCIYGTVDLLKGTTQQITDDWFLPPCAKICLSAWLPYHCKRDQHQYCRLLGRGRNCSEAREEENDHLIIFQWDITVSGCIFSCFCIDLGPSFCLSLFLGGTKEWFITNVQGYLILHLYGIVCPSGSKAFTDFKGCLQLVIAVLCWHHLKIWSYLTSIFVCVFWLDIS